LASREETCRSGGLSFDPRLSLVLHACPKIGGIESIYVVGSRARGTHDSQSDLDVVVVTRFPTCLGRFRRLIKLRGDNIDVNLLSTSLISKVKSGQSSSFIPDLASWRRDGILVHGKDTLPEVLPSMDRHSFASYAFRAAARALWQFRADSNSIEFEDLSHDKRWMLKRAKDWSKLEAFPSVPSEWQEFGTRLKDQVVADMDPNIICRLFAEMLEQWIHDLRFSGLDQAHYVLIKLLTQRRLLWKTLAYRVPIQERSLRAVFLLYRSGSRERAEIFDAASLMRDQPGFSDSKDFGVMWTQVKRAVLEDYRTILGMSGILLT
jgi:predicted nucleotidyltransferase